MQQLTPLQNLQPANRLEQLTDQVGNTFWYSVIAARRITDCGQLLVTFTNPCSPGSVQDWVMLNGSESIPGTVVVAQPVVAFTTSLEGFSCPSVASYVEWLLNDPQTTWWGCSLSEPA